LQYVCSMDFTFTLSNIRAVANEIFLAIKDSKVWAIYGEMGAGKTTFIHSLCDNLGVTSAIGSPTYSIINEYESAGAGTIFHMDWYRLKNEEEAMQAGVEDAIDSGNFCLIEWPERAPRLLPADTAHLVIKVINEKERLISVS
jgi:tRNA threonylcarbamoyladenosine biosynthesis protein TsaE